MTWGTPPSSVSSVTTRWMGLRPGGIDGNGGGEGGDRILQERIIASLPRCRK